MRALICGICGQDGAYLSQLLLNKGYEVYGTSRDANNANYSNLETLGIRDSVKVISMSATDFRSVIQALQRAAPVEIYNLTGQSSVGLSFEQPVETFESISVATINFLESIRLLGGKIRFYNAGSGECYGCTGESLADEHTLFRPSSPYAVAKSAAHWMVANYREAYQLFACTGILFNHESPLRPTRFVTRKIISAAYRIANGSKEVLHLGNMHIVRDWGWAPEYVDAMWRMLQCRKPSDYVIATGHSYSLQEFVDKAFSHVGLDWHKFVVHDETLMRPTDHARAFANPDKARAELPWKANYLMPDIVKMMLEAERGSA